jgi:CheY-like chemotaxis protein
LKDDGLRGLAETAERAARRGADVTRRLLAFARSQPLEPRSIDLNDMVRDMTALVERSLGPTIEIETALPEGLWQTRADPGQVENALLNLVINSRDAMPNGGRLMIETSNVALTAFERRPGAMAPGDYVAVAVSDTGGGMSEEVIARAVEPFFTTKEVGKGSGLGLSMIYGFVRQSGGDMTIESEQGKGTTVRLYLPRVFAPAPAPAERQPARSTRDRETVLLVEDDPDVREFARVALSSLGYRVVEADSGTAALNLLDTSGPIDLLFVDVALPGGVSGLMLAEAVRRRAPGIAVIVTSGDPEAAPDHAAAPDIAFLRKPYTQGDLATMMRAALDRRERVEV